jgi:hypothetical protein
MFFSARYAILSQWLLLTWMKPNSGTPFQTRSLTSRTLLHYIASLPTQPVLEISQHCCTIKQLQYSNAKTSPLQSHGLSTKETILQPELKVRLERMLETSLSDPLCITGRNSDPTNCDDETDDDLPSIEELWDQISRKGDLDRRILEF